MEGGGVGMGGRDGGGEGERVNVNRKWDLNSKR